MTIAEVARCEGISARQAQRYCKAGFQGHVLPSIKVGNAFHIEESDYRQWRIDCGWETPAVSAGVLPPATSSPGEPLPASVSPGDTHPASCAEYPPYPMPADPHGVLTNAPHPHSCNFPHPLACQEYMRREAEKLLEKYRGVPHDED